MRKLVLSIIAAVGLFAGMTAQAGMPGRFGVRLSYELACPGDVNVGGGNKVDGFGNGSGVAIGAVYHLPVISGFYFEPGVTFAYNTYSINKELATNWVNGLSGFSNADVTAASARMTNLRIPVLGGYEFRFALLPGMRIQVFTGPEFCLGLTAKSHMKVSHLTVSDGMYGSKGWLNRYDVKWRFGVGATFMKHLNASISGAVGICDQFNKSPEMRSNLFDITVGYDF